MGNSKSNEPHVALEQVKTFAQNLRNITIGGGTNGQTKITDDPQKFDKKWSDVGNNDSIQSKLSRCNSEDEMEQYELENPGILKRTDVDGVTLLHLAARQKKRNIIPVLLKHVNINVEDNNNWTPLHYAIDEFSNQQIIQLLIKSGANVNAQTKNQESALHLLAPIIKQQTEVLQALIDGGINVNAPDKKGQTVLHYLARYATTELDVNAIACLIDNKANIDALDNEECTPLHRAIEFKNVSVIKRLVNMYQANVTIANTSNRTALHLAMQYLDDAVDEDNLFLDPNIEAVMDTLCTKVRDAQDLCIALQYAVKWGKLNFVKYLLNKNASTETKDENGRSLLHMAVEENKEEIVEFLLSGRPNIPINVIDTKGQTPLHYAVRKELVHIIEILINNGADLKIKTLEEKWSVAHIAVATGNRDVWDALLRHEDKMDSLLLDVSDKKQLNLLEHGMICNDPSMVESLLEKNMKASLLEPDNNKLRDFSAVVLELALDNCIKFENKSAYADFSSISPSQDLSAGEDEHLNNTMYHLSRSKNCDTLLLHPAIKTHIKWKWSEIAPFYYVNMISYLIVCLFVCFISVTEADISPLYLTILIASSLALTIKEVLQLFGNYKEYVKSIDNYIEVGVIIVIVLTMSDLELEHRKRVSAVAYILIGVSLTLMLGKHPKASSSIQLLKTVTYQFFKYFPIYILIIPSFALSFYHLFSESGMSIIAKNADDTSNLFDTSLILLQTMIMILGNFSVDNLNDKHYNFISMTILIIFLIFIAIILVNLLNGLAVSNILGKEELKKSKYRSQVEYLYNAIKSLRSLTQTFKVIKRFYKIKSKSMERIYIFSDFKSKITGKYEFIYSNRIYQEAIAIDKKKVNRNTEYRLIVLNKQLTKMAIAVANNKSEMAKQISDMQKGICDNLKNEIINSSANIEESLKDNSEQLANLHKAFIKQSRDLQELQARMEPSSSAL